VSQALSALLSQFSLQICHVDASDKAFNFSRGNLLCLADGPSASALAQSAICCKLTRARALILDLANPKPVLSVEVLETQ
jgi:hypothetical protein